MGHAGGGKKGHRTGQRSRHVGPEGEQAASSDQIGKPTDGEGGEHRAEQIADATKHHNHEAAHDVRATNIRADGPQQGHSHTGHASQPGPNAKREHVDGVGGNPQAVTHRTVLGDSANAHAPDAAIQEPGDTKHRDDGDRNDHQARHREGNTDQVDAAAHPLRGRDIHIAGIRLRQPADLSSQAIRQHHATQGSDAPTSCTHEA